METDLEVLAERVHRRHLTVPLLLMLAGHSPLTFVAGQLLYALEPLSLLLGWKGLHDWAALLSAPDASTRLTALLSHSSTTSPSSFTQAE